MSRPVPRQPAGNLSTALASRYRPRSFDTLTGQKHVTTVLRHAIAERSVPQQLLFSGGSGLGKTTVARILSAALLCTAPLSERERADACGRCEACLDVLTPERHHPDVVEFDAASNGGKDEIREIAQRAQLAPMNGAVKIYIVDEAHGLSGPGGQAFLKLLEEPPSHVIFMLCTTDPHKMLKTNRGRCVEFELLAPARTELVANLVRICSAEGWVVSNDILGQVVDATDPDLGVRGTVMTLAKLAGPLMNSDVIDDDRLAEILGTAPARLVEDVLLAVDAADPLLALDALDRLRGKTSESSVRVALVRRARQRLLDELRNGHPALVAQYRFDQLVTAQPGRDWTDLVIVGLSRPVVDPSALPVTALPEEARRWHEELTRIIADARKVGSLLYDTTRNARAAAGVVPPKTTRTDKPAAGAPARLTGPGRTRQPAGPASSGTTVPTAPAGPVTGSDSSTPIEPPARLTPTAAQLVAAAAPAPAHFSTVLSRCEVNQEDGTITVTPSDAVRDQLTALEPVLRRAAGRLGVDVQIA